MTKLPSTTANKISTTARDGADHGAAVGFAGLGAAGESDNVTVQPNTRNAKGNPVGTTSFAGSDDS
jgi:hypothetical protein